MWFLNGAKLRTLSSNALQQDSTESSRHSGSGIITPTVRVRKHRFRVCSFTVPQKCNYCTSLMIGMTRQAQMCEGALFDIILATFVTSRLFMFITDCKYTCHSHCSDKAPQQCPVPSEQRKLVWNNVIASSLCCASPSLCSFS